MTRNFALGGDRPIHIDFFLRERPHQLVPHEVFSSVLTDLALWLVYSVNSKAAEKMWLADLYARVSLGKFKSGFSGEYESHKKFLEKNGEEHRM